MILFTVASNKLNFNFFSSRVIQDCDNAINSHVFVIQTSVLPIRLLPYNLGNYCSSLNE